MDNLSIEDLDILVESVTAYEHIHHGVNTAIMILPLEIRNNEEQMKATKDQQEEQRLKMESLTLLKAKLINEKTRLQAATLSR